MSAVRKYARNGGWNLLNRLAIFFAQSAAANTKVAREFRTILRPANADERRRYFSGWQYAVVVYGRDNKTLRRRMPGHAALTEQHAGRGRLWFAADAASAKRIATIWFWGLARASWVAIVRKMGVTRNVAVKNDMVLKVMRALTWVNFQRGKDKQRITLVNRVPYMHKAAPNIEAIALAKARARLAKIDKLTYESGLRIAWAA